MEDCGSGGGGRESETERLSSLNPHKSKRRPERERDRRARDNLTLPISNRDMLNTVSGLLWWKRELRLFQVGILFQTGFIHHRLSRSTRPSQSHCHSQSRPKLGRSRAVPGNFLDGRPISSTDRGRGRGCKLLRRENTGRANDNSSIIFQLPRPHVKHHLQLSSAPGMCEKGEREREKEREREEGR